MKPETQEEKLNRIRKERQDAGVIEAFAPNIDIENIKPFNIVDMFKMDFPPVKHIVEPCIDEDTINIVHAKRGVGKTYFCMSLAYAIATGQDFLKWKIKNSYPTLYLDGEMMPIKITNRFKNIINTFPNDPESVPLYILPKTYYRDVNIKITNIEIQNLIMDFIRENKIKVLVVDNISSLTNGIVENEAIAWEEYLDWEVKVRNMGVTVIRVMHSGKGKEASIRGSSKTEDGADSIMKLVDLNPDDDMSDEARYLRFKLIFTKAREFFGEEARPFEAHMINNKYGEPNWIVKDPSQTKEEMIAQLFKEGYDRKSIMDLADVTKGYLSKIEKKLNSSKIVI